MKTSDIMPGDWFNTPKGPHRITAIQNNDIVFTDYSEDIDAAVDINNLTPIPLTPEILEKNGFRKEEEHRGFSEPYCVYINGDFQYPIKVYPKEGMDRYSRLEIGEYDDGEYMSLLFNHVHELQHTLKLAEIEMDIKSL